MPGAFSSEIGHSFNPCPIGDKVEKCEFLGCNPFNPEIHVCGHERMKENARICPLPEPPYKKKVDTLAFSTPENISPWIPNYE